MDKIISAARLSAQQLGYSSLKELQVKVVSSFVEGNDVFAVLLTGYGKTLCYACLPHLFDYLLQTKEPSIVIVVTPLTAIMEDQVSCGNKTTLLNVLGSLCLCCDICAKSCKCGQCKQNYSMFNFI